MSFEAHYSRLDRALHRVAFAGSAAQRAASDVESALLARQYAGAPVRRPVFITSLPRAGTTLLLDLVAELPEFAAHSYRDMPFVLAPLLWDRVSRGIRSGVSQRERAHADGVTIGIDSPEAFEEVMWKAFWPEKYGRRSIALWSAGETRPEFERFFREHVRKLVALRSRPVEQGRYVSKNNGNIARIPLLRRVFGDCTILVPFRAPVDHAGSLLAQHRRFLEVHEREPFSRRYMADVGHYEFGALHRPFAFPRLTDEGTGYGEDPTRLEYWLAYWVRAFEALLETDAGARFLSFDRLCGDPGGALSGLDDALGLAPGRLGAHAAQRVRTPRRWTPERTPDSGLVDRAEAVHARLVERSIA